jgi:hypothetical protein
MGRVFVVDLDTEAVYVKLMLRLYEIIGQQRIQIQQMQEVLNKDKKQSKLDVGKSKLSNSNNR